MMESLNRSTGNTTCTIAGSLRWQAPEPIYGLETEIEDDSTGVELVYELSPLNERTREYFGE